MTDKSNDSLIQIATLAGGCFWCIESAFNSIKGVSSAISGYMGGQVKNPTYEDICTGTSGHAEVVQVQFDSSVISYREILEIFFSLHNPTQLNRQGNDIGTQYRSEIFSHDTEQQETANAVIEEITQSQVFIEPVVTKVSPAVIFYQAEAYHQGYVENNPNNQYCYYLVAPKLAKFRETFVNKLK
ncbi:peptide-methionine (S)-S-oxide reductase MsrA [Colwellia sp. E2M01]|uniref:peptide-methionine (S)-S-oxide reductase MsrA n=1 Tax=Colwellia sp. E2M01 TaxID=2841561 RepID=UPI001C081BAD|nr:peptide-methionine (S)-S-oxide reductase MsrA [Colwellia sp. E2M01]MBU2871156.1 peptide-methionine (S)-S-oxide reductase MsrA [Colwellia sp. E2M01]